MPRTSLNRDSEFVVGEEKILNYILAFLFFGLFMYGLIDALLYQLKKLTYLNAIFAVALIPAIFSFQKARSKRVYIRVNKKGIYQDERLLTNWNNYLKAYITQKEVVFSVQDNFLLVVEYRKDGFDKGFRKKIALTNTQNKSEEDVLEAIKFFYKEFVNESA